MEGKGCTLSLLTPGAIIQRKAKMHNNMWRIQYVVWAFKETAKKVLHLFSVGYDINMTDKRKGAC